MKLTLDQGLATVIGAAMGVAGLWWFSPDQHDIIALKDKEIATLTGRVGDLSDSLAAEAASLKTCDVKAAALGADLEAMAERLRASIQTGPTCDAIRDEFDQAEEGWQSERLDWQVKEGDFEKLLQDASLRQEQAETDAEAARADLQQTLEQFRALQARIDRNLDMRINHDAVSGILSMLLGKSADLSAESSPERLRAFEREVRDALGHVEDFRGDYEELEFYFNADIQDFHERLRERNDAGLPPIDAETMQRRLNELLESFSARQKSFDEQLERLLQAQSQLQSVN